MIVQLDYHSDVVVIARTDLGIVSGETRWTVFKSTHALRMRIAASICNRQMRRSKGSLGIDILKRQSSV
jgi:hypothetical protein